jgi:hypothetical protein
MNWKECSKIVFAKDKIVCMDNHKESTTIATKNN